MWQYFLNFKDIELMIFLSFLIITSGYLHSWLIGIPFIGEISLTQVTIMSFALLLVHFQKKKQQNFVIIFWGSLIGFIASFWLGLLKLDQAGYSLVLDNLIPFLLPSLIVFGLDSVESKVKYILLIELLIIISHTLSGLFEQSLPFKTAFSFSLGLTIPTLLWELLFVFYLQKRKKKKHQ